MRIQLEKQEAVLVAFRRYLFDLAKVLVKKDEKISKRIKLFGETNLTNLGNILYFDLKTLKKLNNELMTYIIYNGSLILKKDSLTEVLAFNILKKCFRGVSICEDNLKLIMKNEFSFESQDEREDFISWGKAYDKKHKRCFFGFSYEKG